ncbi:MAG: PHP domain-containing protein [Pseudomonadota bacterium]
MRLDIHIHTTAFSHCSTMSPDEMMESALRKGLDGVCITEHDKMWSPRDAQALSDKHGLAVFRGMEITTTGGDILVFGVEKEPGVMLTPQAVRRQVDDARGVAIAAHPFRGFLLFGFSALQMDLAQAADNPTFASVQGLEVCNGLVTQDENELAHKVADVLGLLKVGGSDAHRPEAVGTCVMSFDDVLKTERELIDAVLGGAYRLEGPNGK